MCVSFIYRFMHYCMGPRRTHFLTMQNSYQYGFDPSNSVNVVYLYQAF